MLPLAARLLKPLSAMLSDWLGPVAIKVDKAILAGYDWGARNADIVAALWPDRVKGLVSVSGYLIGSQEAGRQPLPPKAELQWWYQYYFATERGREGYATFGFLRGTG